MTLSRSFEPISRERFESARLIAEHPPRLHHPNKALLFDLTSPPGADHRGELEVTRWAEMPLPEVFRGPPAIETQNGVFAYERPQAREWYLNFAHHDLFCAYGGPLFAQDELQVAEHPVLASLREALIDGDAITRPLAVESGAPTPVLIRGVERRACIDAGALYGHRFARADRATIERAVTLLDPPTITNLIAIEAPYGGRGPYRSLELDYILSTAFSGFNAARLESGPPIIHTGFWGCGAYGGDRVLMTMLQLIAAGMAEVERLVFHLVDPSSTDFFAEAERRLASIAAAPIATQKLLSRILEMRFSWGASNGT